MFFKNKRQVREPDETVRLSKHIEMVSWLGKGDDGYTRLQFGLNRIDDKGNQRRTFWPQHIVELLESLAAIAIAVGQSPGIRPELAAELKDVGSEVTKVLENRGTNGAAVEAPTNGPRLFG